MEESQPQVVPIGQPVVEEVKEEQPIRLGIIKRGDVTIGGLICKCGNNDQGNFFTYKKTCVEKDERGRHKRWVEMRYMCGNKKCSESISKQLVAEQYKQITSS